MIKMLAALRGKRTGEANMSKRNKRLLSAAVGAALAAGTMGVSTSPARADAVLLIPVFFPTLCPLPCSGNFNRTVGPGFSQLPDTYSFAVLADLNFSASARNQFDNANELITGFTLTLWQGLIPDPAHTDDTLVATAGPQEIVGSFNLAGTLNAVLDPGIYYLEVTGVQPFVVTGYNGSFEFSAVAIPGPVAGAGLPGLVMACGGLLAWTRRRRAA